MSSFVESNEKYNPQLANPPARRPMRRRETHVIQTRGWLEVVGFSGVSEGSAGSQWYDKAIKVVLRRCESPQPREALEHAARTGKPKDSGVCMLRMINGASHEAHHMSLLAKIIQKKIPQKLRFHLILLLTRKLCL